MKKRNNKFIFLSTVLIGVFFVSCAPGNSANNISPLPTKASLTPTVMLTSGPTILATNNTVSISETPIAMLTNIPEPEHTATNVFLPSTCSTYPYPASIHYANTDEYGDGYISHVSVASVQDKSHNEIILVLVTQWLEHYKTASEAPSAAIDDYKVRQIDLIDPSCDPFFTIVAQVRFSATPSHIPHDMASFGAPNPDGTWVMQAPFGVFIDGNDYRLRMVFGWGT